MNNDIDYKPVVEKITTGSRIKGTTILIDNIQHNIGGLFIDVPVKIQLSKITQTITLLIEQILTIDGISIRKLNMKDIRNPIKKKNYKVSQRNVISNKKELGNNILEIGMKSGGFNWLKNIFNIVNIFINKSLDGKHQYKGILFIGDKKIGSSKFNATKYNGGKGMLPSIKAKSEIKLNQGNEGVLTCRLNVPITGLNRDHAQNISYHVETNIGVYVDDYQVSEASLSEDFVSGSISYSTLLTTGDHQLEIVNKT